MSDRKHTSDHLDKALRHVVIMSTGPDSGAGNGCGNSSSVDGTIVIASAGSGGLSAQAVSRLTTMRANADWIFREDGSMIGLFGEIHGSLLEEAVFLLFEHQPSPCDVPWHKNIARDIAKHPDSCLLQKTVVEGYSARLMSEGLSFQRSGQPWLQWGDGDDGSLVKALSFNQSEAFYVSYEKDKDNVYVLQASRAGCKNARTLVLQH
jgi:hypothetical protein